MLSGAVRTSQSIPKLMSMDVLALHRKVDTILALLEKFHGWVMSIVHDKLYTFRLSNIIHIIQYQTIKHAELKLVKLKMHQCYNKTAMRT